MARNILNKKMATVPRWDDNYISELINKIISVIEEYAQQEQLSKIKNKNTIKNSKRFMQKWSKEEDAPLGKELGYPACCVKEYCNQPLALFHHGKPSKNELIRYKAGYIDGQFTGFVPCIFHAKQIIKGKIMLQSLIKDRNQNFPQFPGAYFFKADNT